MYLRKIQIASILFVLVMSTSFGAFAQTYTINSTNGSSANAGQSYGYYAMPSPPSGSTWSAYGGTVSYQSPSGATVTWNCGYSSGTVYLRNSSGTTLAYYNVTIVQSTALVAGYASSSQNIISGTTPATLSCTATSGGNCAGGAYSYQWESSTNGTTYTSISGATSLNYSPGSLTASITYYRVRSWQGTPTPNTYSNVVTINTYPAVVAGSISPSLQNINYNTTPPTALTLSGTSGGNGVYSYQWQSSTSTVLSSFTNIIGATSPSYTVGQLTVPTYYRIAVSSVGTTVFSNYVTLNVYPQLTVGGISPSSLNISYNSSPGLLTCSTPQGGNGVYSYQWFLSTDNNTYNPIAGASGPTFQSYTPGNLTSTSFYRVVVTSNNATVTSGVSQINVPKTFGVPIADNLIGNINSDKNWVISSGYDASGNLLSQGKKFYDNSGRLLQSQSKVFYRSAPNTVYTHVLASQPVRDVNGREVLNTLAAPIDYADFNYKPDFILAPDNSYYTYKNFDRFNQSGSEADKTNAPDQVGSQQTIGTLGWYYGPFNTWEPYTPTDIFPYSRTTMYKDGTNNKKSQANVGSSFVTGWTAHQTSSYVTPVSGELANYIASRNQLFPSTQIGMTPSTMYSNAIQTVGKDENGNEVVTISDIGGKLLMKARPGSDWTANNSVSIASISSLYNQQLNCVTGSSVTIQSIAGGNNMMIYLVGSTGAITLVYNGVSSGAPLNSNLGTGTVLIASDVAFSASYTSGGNAYTSGSSTNSSNSVLTCVTGSNVTLQSFTGSGNVNINLISPTGLMNSVYNGSSLTVPLNSNLGTGTVVITSGTTFSVNYTSGGVSYSSGSSTTLGSAPSFSYFKILADNTTVNITGSYTLYDMRTEAAASLNAGTLNRGYYKIVSNSGIVNATYSNSFTDISYNFYNELGQMVATVAPNGAKLLLGTGYTSYSSISLVPFATTYTYDAQGRLVSTKSFDAGTSNFAYRMDGKIRFSQNDLQALSGSFSYTNYDNLGRAIESGQYDGSGTSFATASTSSSILESTEPLAAGLGSGIKTDVIQTTYDIADNSYGAPYSTTYNYIQDAANLGGAVSTSKRYSQVANGTAPLIGNLVSQTWFNYDEEGKVLWSIKYIASLGSVGYKTTDYTYDALSRLVKKVFQKNTPSETFVHYFNYDPANGSLWTVYTNTVDNQSTASLQAKYIYYLHGGIKRVELGNGIQGLDYTYTLQGAPKAINNINTSADPNNDAIANNNTYPDAFGEVLDYYTNDYQNMRSSGAQYIYGVNNNPATDSYSGNIKAMSWFSSKPPGSGASNAPVTYNYTYDPKYQFTGAQWGTVNTPFPTNSPLASYSTTSINQENVSGYDLNGNILGLSRTGSNGTVTDQLTYTYGLGNNNWLTKIVNTGSQNETYNFTYDNLGREVSENSGTPATTKYIKYDLMGRVTMVASDVNFSQLLAKFIYDESGKRIEKISYGPGPAYSPILATYYFGDVIYTQPNATGAFTETEYQVSGGSGRIGNYYKSNGLYTYELKDHLGNIRAVIAKTGTVQTATDYYPFGYMIATYGGGYRYGYQGQTAEKDGETGWNNFELRMYSSRFGRWMTMDPKGQYFSPYVGMGNNPVTGVDADGGENDDWVRRPNGSIYWDPNAISQETTKAGETWLGTTLDFNFISYISSTLWDGTTLFGLIDPSGKKLITDITVTGLKDDGGNLTNIKVMSVTKPGPTPVGTARMYYPGISSNLQHIFSLTNDANGLNFDFEQHASVAPFEELGLGVLGYNIVNVAQKFTFNYNAGELAIKAYTDLFPSATLTLNGQTIMQYDQPSFNKNFQVPINTLGEGSLPLREATSYKTAFWYPRY